MKESDEKAGLDKTEMGLSDYLKTHNTCDRITKV